MTEPVTPKRRGRPPKVVPTDVVRVEPGLDDAGMDVELVDLRADTPRGQLADEIEEYIRDGLAVDRRVPIQYGGDPMGHTPIQSR